jgi:hypothetical protein
MAEYTLNKTVYPKSIYENVIDTSFSQQQPVLPLEETINIGQFFELYDKLFYDIPAEGQINSHTYLIQKSSEYVNIGSNSEEIQVLLDEITSLQQENLRLNQQMLNTQISSSNLNT